MEINDMKERVRLFLTLQKLDLLLLKAQLVH